MNLKDRRNPDSNLIKVGSLINKLYRVWFQNKILSKNSKINWLNQKRGKFPFEILFPGKYRKYAEVC